MTTQTNTLAVFSVGDMLEWASQSNGSTTKKVGRVETIIPPGKRLSEEQRREADASGSPRNHISYVVRVPNKSGLGKGKLYWPRANQLTKCATQA